MSINEIHVNVKKRLKLSEARCFHITWMMTNKLYTSPYIHLHKNDKKKYPEFCAPFMLHEQKNLIEFFFFNKQGFDIHCYLILKIKNFHEKI